MSTCPCGSQITYENCCGLYLEEKQVPQTPEKLMRSRYTAYSLAKIDYIKKTMKGKALIGFNEVEALQWAQNVTWVGLEIIQAKPAEEGIGFVEFIASFNEEDKLKKIQERSEFHQENGVWFYVSGTHVSRPRKIKKTSPSRNSPCPCGSGKKFKNCHAK